MPKLTPFRDKDLDLLKERAPTGTYAVVSGLVEDLNAARRLLRDMAVMHGCDGFNKGCSCPRCAVNGYLTACAGGGEDA